MTLGQQVRQSQAILSGSGRYDSLAEYLDAEERECAFCGKTITLASDGAWEDESGACGCGAGEHEPEGGDWGISPSENQRINGGTN